MPLTYAKKAADKTVALFKRVRHPVEKKINKQSTVVRYTFGSLTIVAGIINLVNPLIPGMFLIIAGVGIIHKTRKSVTTNFKAVAILVKDKTQAKLEQIKATTKYKKAIVTDAFRINTRRFSGKLTRLLLEKRPLKAKKLYKQ